MEKVHDSTEAIPVDQETDNAFQIKQQAVNNGIHADGS